MTRTKLLSILQEETDGFKEQSRLRDDVLDAMEQAYIKGKDEQLTLTDIVRQSEQLVCPNNEQHIVKKESVGKYCMVCGLLK